MAYVTHICTQFKAFDQEYNKVYTLVGMKTWFSMLSKISPWASTKTAISRYIWKLNIKVLANGKLFEQKSCCICYLQQSKLLSLGTYTPDASQEALSLFLWRHRVFPEFPPMYLSPGITVLNSKTLKSFTIFYE